MNLVPAVFILAAHGGVVFKQELAAARVPPHHHAVIQRSQAAAVLVIRRGSQLQQSLREEQGDVSTDQSRSEQTSVVSRLPIIRIFV